MNELDRIKAEEDRLLSIFSELDENELEVAKGLIRQAAFMQVTLEDLQKEINENGCVGEYKNGKEQYGKKQSSELQAYNQTLRSYNAVIGKLLKIVPRVPVHIESADEIAERLRKQREANRSTPQELEQWHKNFCDLLHKEMETRDESND